MWFRNDGDEATIAGRVVDDSGHPLVGAAIVAGRHGATADMDGQFQFSWIPDSRAAHNLTVRFVGFESFERQIVVQPSDSIWVEAVLEVGGLVICCEFAPPTLKAKLVPRGEADSDLAEVRGFLVDADSIALANYRVVFRGQDRFDVKTSQEGHFLLGVPPGQYTVVVYPPDSPCADQFAKRIRPPYTIEGGEYHLALHLGYFVATSPPATLPFRRHDQ